MNIFNLDQVLIKHGLHRRGVLTLNHEEITGLAFEDIDPDRYLSLVLIGNIGSSFWSEFSQSSEFTDGEADALDRWSRRIADDLARQLDARALYPFEGPPYYPFQQWAERAEALSQSPLGLMIHAEYGLWHAYRFALLMPDLPDETGLAPVQDSPCLSCKDQPCLHSCPVDAFQAQGYEVDKCANFLNQNEQARCHEMGCEARNACPAGVGYHYLPAQHRFHLQAFLRNRPKNRPAV